jgi:replicative DNA helicase
MQVYSKKDLFRHWAESEAASVIATGFPKLDAALGGGLPAGHLTTILGYSGTGKSEFVRHIGRNAAANKVGVVHVDVELGPDEIMRRELSQLSRIPSAHLRRKRFTAEENDAIRAAQRVIEADPYTVLLCPDEPLKLGKLGEFIELMLAGLQRKENIIILDSAQRLADGQEIQDDRQSLTKFFRWAERFAKRTGAALICVSEQKRGSDGREPDVGDVLTSGAESRAIEYTAHVLMGLFPADPITKTEARAAEDLAERYIKLIIGKCRDGSVGTLPAFLRATKPCWDLAEVDVSAKANPLAVTRALSKMDNDRGYNATELGKLWGVSNHKAIQYRNYAIERGLIEEKNKLFFKKELDSKTVVR